MGLFLQENVVDMLAAKACTVESLLESLQTMHRHDTLGLLLLLLLRPLLSVLLLLVS